MDSTKTLTAVLASGPPPAAPILTSFKINNGAALTANSSVLLTNACAQESSATVVAFMASESPDFAGAMWFPYGPVPLFTLSPTAGVKTVYFKVKNSAGGESAVTTDTITLGGGGYTVVAWGRNDDGQCDVPAPNSGFVAVAGGYAHSLGLKSDGSIAIWGYNSSNGVPEPNRDFMDVGGRIVSQFGSEVRWFDRGVGIGLQGSVRGPHPETAVLWRWLRGANTVWDSNPTVRLWHGWIMLRVNVSFPYRTRVVAVSAAGDQSLGLKADGLDCRVGKFR
jgi:hypothetical protein